MKMQKIIILFLLFLLLLPQHIVFANHDHEWTYLDNVADQAYQLTRYGEYEKAEELMKHFSNKFETSDNLKQVSLSNLRVLTVSYDEAIRALSSDNEDAEDKLQKVLKFRLAVDAIHSMYQPLWKEMEGSVMSSFQKMKESFHANDSETFNSELNHFLEVFNTIYPSLVIDINPEQVSELDSHIAFFGQYETASAIEQQSQIKMMENDLIQLFKNMHMEQSDPSFVWVSTSITTVILITLLYVGWKKYKGNVTVS